MLDCGESDALPASVSKNAGLVPCQVFDMCEKPSEEKRGSAENAFSKWTDEQRSEASNRELKDHLRASK